MMNAYNIPPSSGGAVPPQQHPSPHQHPQYPHLQQPHGMPQQQPHGIPQQQQQHGIPQQYAYPQQHAVPQQYPHPQQHAVPQQQQQQQQQPQMGATTTPGMATTTPAATAPTSNPSPSNNMGMRRPPYVDPQTNFVFDVNDPEYEGWLTKQSMWLKDWRRRYFLLKGSKLFFSKSDRYSAPHGMIDLALCTTVKSADMKTRKRHSFEISTPDTTYLLYADSEKEKDDWIGSVGRAIVRCSNTYYPQGGAQAGGGGGAGGAGAQAGGQRAVDYGPYGNVEDEDDDDDDYDDDNPYFISRRN